ncbi:unnamed protein product [Polarella glacialis]|uniref:Uncharacterized protein n=1 Tax=Polarella glacialis TaxID=89957 RepID=A0A813LT69_POLGL|nr:unnamed protein product [Polarella glacialis]CAE8739133.1 unnamed protein product [Polarella glacialis]|mmetsp:Transcript_6522/g.10484  ORF Transcript_6522/g.10484 Transcript_6522/m.10484 type:complete len:85 (+) Transcript_6522:115-369(+)
MQQPGEAVADFARRGNTVARMMARSKGLPVPFATAGLANCSETGKGYTMWTKDYPFRFDSGIISILVPVGVSFGGVIAIARMLR